MCFSCPPSTGAFPGAGIPVYLYEFVYRAHVHRNVRPDFVKADHADDVAFMFGSCFWEGETKVIGQWDTHASPAHAFNCTQLHLH